MLYNVGFVPAPDRIVYVLSEGVMPAEADDLGTFNHPDDGTHDNHVIYQHVQDKLYHLGEHNMQVVRIFVNDFIDLTDISVDDNTVALAVAGTKQIVVEYTPSDASNKTVNYVSSTPAVATVNATGLITGVAPGTTNVTATSTDGSHAEVIVVTVT